MGEGRAVQGLCFLQGEGLLAGGHPHSAAGQGRGLACPLLSPLPYRTVLLQPVLGTGCRVPEPERGESSSLRSGDLTSCQGLSVTITKLETSRVVDFHGGFILDVIASSE